jgi:hypothetical protein
VPPLAMHMMLARGLARDLGSSVLLDEQGAYYLGATTPDIRVITRWDRAKTHFFDLDDFGHQSGVAALFEDHPELSRAAALERHIASFVAGYLTHLEMDEAWIGGVFRPCFGERSPLKGDVLANVLDRVLQYELDRREREDALAVDEVRRELLAATVAEIAGFLDEDTLLRWREVSADVLCHPPTWDRFGVIASRHLRAYGVESEADVAHFMRNIPDLLDQSVRCVTQERIEAFLDRARTRSRAVLEEYLS